jgi:hypothetical protein
MTVSRLHPCSSVVATAFRPVPGLKEKHEISHALLHRGSFMDLLYWLNARGSAHPRLAEEPPGKVVNF